MNDPEFVEKIKENFHSKNSIVAALFENCTEMADCVGVKVKWKIESIDEKKIVESSRLSKLINRLATLGGAFCLGGQLNPIQALKKRQRDVKKLQR